ncbi:MAG: hypothetical protein AMJ65_05615 [Phycisphaerae bacterium SG8_4]|nr:MAG: hypothetical protein AMJ65_05615 [Phycisphaerae bacterium SG8_4]
MLSDEQKQLLFDHSLELTTEERAAQAEVLISSSNEAAYIRSKLKTALAPLDTLLDEPCPDDLAERTVWRLMQVAKVERAAREPVAAGSMPWSDYAQVGAIAAVVLLAVSVLIPSFSFARHHYRKHVCQNQLAGIGSGLARYCSDFEGNLPAVSTDISRPWHRVGDQSEESQSNTRNPYLLLKLGYHSRPRDFICCGRMQRKVSQLDVSEVSRFDDFPGGELISYSFRIVCRAPVKLSLLAGMPLMADRNPLFEDMQGDELRVRLDEKLATTPSMNHKRRGQNVLFAGGHVRFLKTRHVGVPQDDIFTVQNVVEYQGNERPACEKDPFLAP